MTYLQIKCLYASFDWNGFLSIRQSQKQILIIYMNRSNNLQNFDFVEILMQSVGLQVQKFAFEIRSFLKNK